MVGKDNVNDQKRLIKFHGGVNFILQWYWSKNSSSFNDVGFCFETKSRKQICNAVWEIENLGNLIANRKKYCQELLRP